MPRKFLNRFLPDQETLHTRLHGKWYLRPFDYLMHDPALWYISRRGTCSALALGAFISCLPIPGHMVMAVLGALYWRINMPVALAAVWINNPLTIGPIYFAAYELGKHVLDVLHLGDEPKGAIVHPWLAPELSKAWHILEPVLLGGVIEGALFAVAAYAAFDLAWRFSIRGRWLRRQKLRREKAERSG
ncbi:MAG: DUF2062 domain-containing protein [Bacillota bacterium]